MCFNIQEGDVSMYMTNFAKQRGKGEDIMAYDKCHVVILIVNLVGH